MRSILRVNGCIRRLTQSKKIFNTRHYATQQTPSERVVSLLSSNFLCQLSSFTPCGVDEDNSSSSVYTSILPYIMISKSQADEIFTELQQTNGSLPEKDESEEPTTTEPTLKAKKRPGMMKSDDSIEHYDYDPSKCFQKFDIILCTKNDSPHNINFSSVPNVFEGHTSEAIFRSGPGLVSMSVGLNNTELNEKFNAASRYPPRCVISASIEKVPKESKAFKLLWKQHFAHHPNVNVKLKMNDVHMYRLGGLKSAQFVNISSDVTLISDLEEFRSAQPDTFSKKQTELISRLNTSSDVLDNMLHHYNLKINSKFAFALDRFGIRILGMDGDEWVEYYLEFGEDIQTEDALNKFFFDIQK
ncbi:hypothetical protein AKO1_011033 [Acrasis kona]|uniref:Uncharacterized protein n=1 Tax=Acrasis kona TaxID=1008807 RepID=A0AAW2YUI0_9EUKA